MGEVPWVIFFFTLWVKSFQSVFFSLYRIGPFGQSSFHSVGEVPSVGFLFTLWEKSLQSVFFSLDRIGPFGQSSFHSVGEVPSVCFLFTLWEKSLQSVFFSLYKGSSFGRSSFHSFLTEFFSFWKISVCSSSKRGYKEENGGTCYNYLYAGKEGDGLFWGVPLKFSCNYSHR